MAAKPATPIGVMAASVPPAIMASASPRWMMRKASPMEWALVGAGGCGGLVGSARAVFDGHVSGGEVDDGAGNEEGRNLAGTAVEQVDVFALDDVETADAGADVNADSVAVLRRDLKTGVGHSLGGGGECEVDEAAHFAGLFFVHEEERVEVLDLGGEADGMTGEIEGFDLGHAALSQPADLPRPQGWFCRPRREARGR